MRFSIQTKWVILFVLFLIGIIGTAVILQQRKKNEQKKIVQEKFSYSQGVPNPIFSNPDLLTVKNKNPVEGPPYFSQRTVQVPQLHWQIRYFQPVIKSIVFKDEALFLETEYEDLNNNAKRVLVFVGGKFLNKNFPIVPLVKNEQIIRARDRSHLEELLLLNQRIQIEYLQTAENYQNASNFDVCARFNDPICQMAEYVYQHQDDYIKFYQTGELHEDIFVMALSINENLNEN